MAAASTHVDLDTRVLNGTRVEMQPRLKIGPRVRWVGVTVASVMLVGALVTGVAAGFVYDSRGHGGGEFALAGSSWTYISTFHGELSFFDATGKPVGGVVRLLENPSGAGSVQLGVNGKAYQFDEPGDYPIRDSKGTLIGTARLRTIDAATWQRETLDFLAKYGLRKMPQTESETLAFHQKVARQRWDEWGTMEERGGVVGSGPLGVYGYDDESSTFWKVRGAVKVTVRGPDGQVHDVGGPASNAIAATDDPEITIVRNGVPATLNGFGRHAIRDEQGEVLLVLEVEPLPSP